MRTKENIYNTKIYPLMYKMLEICKKNDISLFELEMTLNKLIGKTLLSEIDCYKL